ncbi:MAG: hypothetical protein U5O16_00065 [Rhodococcus sp. (in: high G+C Gram-positive bacteria)]|uniref:hypothetical protein n=1 Tax=Rhodococcus sp. TaxID=1831 RepID=UPI002ADB2BEB|nr:hypothetical protein [Rhodococcus sp. (in: high G+C Gram-positive bacteria)]
MGNRDAIRLLDTVPGRTFVSGMVDDYQRSGAGLSEAAFLRSRSMAELVWAAQGDISGYLYGGAFDDALSVDPHDPGIVAMAEATVAELAAPSREMFISPQRHHGCVDVLRQPRATNRRASREVLPAGALWTATPLDGDVDTWTHSRETDEPENLYEIHFKPTQIRVARIDSAADWITLLRSHARIDPTAGTMYPDWDSIASSVDAVHLSLLGLLTAHPRLSEVPATDSRDNYGHSKSGAWAGVGDWSTVSTAWIVLPEHGRWVPSMEKSLDR